MFTKFSFSMLRPRRHDAEEMRERARAASMPRPSSPLDFSDGELPDSYSAKRTRQLSLEALSLESVIAPTLQPMRPFMAPREVLMGESPRRQGQSMADWAREDMSRRPSLAVQAALGAADMGMLSLAVPLTTPGVSK